MNEQHNLIHNSKELKLKEGGVLIIRGDNKNSTIENWDCPLAFSLGAAALQAAKSYLERAVQHLYPLELRCNQKNN